MMGVQKTAETSGASAVRVDGAVEHLSKQAAALKGYVEQFLADVRSA